MRPHCLNGELARLLVDRLERRGLDPRLVTYPGDPGDEEAVEEFVIVNPAAPERGEVRVGDDGSVTWERPRPRPRPHVYAAVTNRPARLHCCRL